MEDLSYYDSQVAYQKRVGEIEKERFKLEREMFSMMKSDERLRNLRTAKLRMYWQQICEREKIAHARNDDLLKDFNQLEIKLAAMETQTKKLKTMKLEYDEKVKRMYVKWHQDVEVARAKRQLQDRKQAKIPVIERPSSSSPNNQSFETASTMDRSQKDKTSPICNDEASKPHILPRSPGASLIERSSDPSQDSLLTRSPPPAFADKNSFKSTQPSTSTPESSIKAVKIIPTIPTAVMQEEENADDDISDSFFHSDESSQQSHREKSADLSQTVLPLRPESTSATVVAVHVHKQNSQDISEQKQSNSTHSQSHSAHSLTGTDAISENRPAMSPEPQPDSKDSSDSFASDLSEKIVALPAKPLNTSSSPQRQSLKASDAYQAMLKQYTGERQVSEESEEDDFEDIFSGDGTGRSVEKNDDQRVKPSIGESSKSSKSVHIPTEASVRFSSEAKEKTSRHLHKAGWDTDSDEEHEEGYLSNTGGSSRWDKKLRQYDDDDDDFFS